MGIQGKKSEQGNVLLCVLCTILVVSIIGANILFNSVTRFNAASSQVRSWKQSLYAAEAGGDLAYAEIRKTILDPTNAFSASSGWTYSGGTYSNFPLTFGHDSLSTSATAGIFYYDVNGNPWYRIRANGTTVDSVVGDAVAGRDQDRPVAGLGLENQCRRGPGGRSRQVERPGFGTQRKDGHAGRRQQK